MRLAGVLAALRADEGMSRIEQAAAQAAVPQTLDVVAPGGIHAPAIAMITQARAGHGVVVAVTATGRDADDLAGALACYLPAGDIAVLPAWETLPHERLSPRSDTVARRLATMRRLAHPEDGASGGPVRVLVTPARALLQPVVAGLGDLRPVSVRAGDQVSLESVVEALAAAAYTRVDIVEQRGQMAVRGGILDVFAPTDEHPVRIEFWGDTVEEVRWFSVADQRSLEIAPQGLWAPPCRELLLTDSVRARAASLVNQIPGASDMLEKMSQGIAVEGMEALIPVLVDRLEPVLDLTGDDAIVVVSDPERVRRRAHDLVATTEEFLAAAWSSAASGGNTPIDLSAASFLDLDQVHDVARRHHDAWWTISPFGLDLADLSPQADGGADEPTVIAVGAREVEGYRGDIARAVSDLRGLEREGWRLVATTQGLGSARRMVEQLSAQDTAARVVTDIPDSPEPGVIQVTVAPSGPGFVAPELRLAVFTESDLTGRSGPSTKDMRRLAHRRRGTVDPLDLHPGDYVVHERHGVGRFVELTQRSVGTGENEAVREYLVLEYAPSRRGQPPDRLFVPTDQLDQITKYVGGEAPTLSKMGGSDWAATKRAARKHVREIAGELIRLYSARMATEGHAFGPDTPWQHELEDAFEYVETPDQLVTIDEVKADMEKPIPMDRLICGDVGYGKTEIAVRAAFKAVQDGMQVAVLVPTTLLVSQHLETFTERYAPFPVTVKPLSRFQTDKEARETLEGLADGSIDVVIGTHRLLSGTVRFKKLGLVIIDEEQRFGVEHKETLKAMRTSVDVLSMSATPIPRTLEMAVTGIREMSTLATPPEERHPVLTYVGAYEDKQIAAAIRRELLRDGQVFYVHNRVESIDRAAAHLAELVPEARIATAHGQMHEKQLDSVIRDFWDKQFDVLVCTTIVETGLDISNANTLIVERADMFGLSQLHQLRGRVGRGRERAYAYFLYPPEKPLTQTAHDRLATIAAHTDLGAGMQVAMKDLEIRGAGNLLGGEQSGHIEGVGFDLYMRMVGEAVAALRGNYVEQPAEVSIQLPVDAHIPEAYISGERLRLEAYRKVAEATTSEALEHVRAELTDRYGAIPGAVDNLFQVAAFRNRAREVGLTDVSTQGHYVRFAPVTLPESKLLRLKRLYPGAIVKPAVRTVLVPAPATARIGGVPVTGGPLLAWATQFVEAVVAGSVAAGAAVADPAVADAAAPRI